MTTDTQLQEKTLEPPERIRVEIRAATGDNWIGIAYCKGYAGDPSTIHEYFRADLLNATSDSARRAAEEIYDQLTWYADSNTVEMIVAIISKHFAAAPTDNDAETFSARVVDSNWCAGATFGWNCALAENREKFLAALKSRMNKGDEPLDVPDESNQNVNR